MRYGVPREATRNSLIGSEVQQQAEVGLDAGEAFRAERIVASNRFRRTGPRNGRRMKQIRVTLPDELIARLHPVVKERDRVIKVALEEYLAIPTLDTPCPGPRMVRALGPKRRSKR